MNQLIVGRLSLPKKKKRIQTYWSSGFRITPRVQVYTYHLDTATHFRAVNKKQVTAAAKRKQRQKNNKHQSC